MNIDWTTERHARLINFAGVRIEAELLDDTSDLAETELCFATTPDDLQRAFGQKEPTQ